MPVNLSLSLPVSYLVGSNPVAVQMTGKWLPETTDSASNDLESVVLALDLEDDDTIILQNIDGYYY